MKLQHNNIKIKVSEDFQQLEYGIKKEDMGLILEILRSRMYKNPIASICREIASNARDANREANNNDPISIRFEDNVLFESEACIVFQDEGVGISPDRMADVFVNYGSSTKRDTNDLTGGFGLGAKTPFSYTDGYSIVTRYNGMEYTYLTAIENGKEGKMFLVDSQETTKQNGTQIIVPIQNDDRITFEKEVYKATLFWDIKPEYINFNKKCTYTEEYKYNNCKIISSIQNYGYYSHMLNSGTYLLIDGIMYDLDTNIIKTNTYFGNHDETVIVLLSFETGELNISANRESVQYDKETIEKIKNRLDDFHNHIKNKTFELVNNQDNYFKACLLVNDLFNKKSKEHGVPFFKDILKLSKKDFAFNEKQIDTNINTRMVKISLIDGDKRKSKSAHVINDDYKNYPIYLLDQPKRKIGQNRTIEAESDKHILIECVCNSVFNFSNMSYREKRYNSTNVRRTLNTIKRFKEWGMPIKNYSEVEKTKIKRSSETKPKKAYVTLKVRIFDKNSVDDYKTEIRIDPLYIYRGQTLINESECCYFSSDTINKEYWDAKQYFKINVAKPITVILVSKRFEKHLKGRIKHLDVYVEENKKNVVQKAIDAEYIKENTEYTSYYYFNFVFNDKILADAIKWVSDINKNKFKNDIPDYIKKEYPVSQMAKYCVNHINSITTKYPLLKEYKRYNSDVTDKEWNDYIAMVDLIEETQQNKLKVA